MPGVPDGRTELEKERRADLLLLVTACIWGFAFVAQREGMSHVGPFTFNAVRFALGAAILIPVAALSSKRKAPAAGGHGNVLMPGLLAGTVLFAGASLQQTGLVYTTAGNAGFVTGLYVVIVPVLGLLAGRKTPGLSWVAALLSISGLYLLTSSGSGRMATGDMLVLGGAFFWALHIQVVSRYVGRTGAARLAAVQFSVCSILSLAVAVVVEQMEFSGIRQAALPLAYGGLVSVGIAYTLQVVAQKDAHPSHAAVLMSLEAVFAAVGGWMLLRETMTPAALAGCAIMLAAMLISAKGLSRHGEKGCVQL